ncbi:hypothetical protein ACF08N_05715 [Streptomyces sp. NPDC015127]|uniref:hypothetical protein n=1 Tax=Streptomyces sp. NPDC015127 TaxID=3364939 RepID=UPI0036FBA198
MSRVTGSSGPGGEGLHHELHGGEQFAGARVAGGEVLGREGAVVDAQGEAVAVEDVEDVLGAAHEAEHLGDVHDIAGRAYASRSPNFGR